MVMRATVPPALIGMTATADELNSLDASGFVVLMDDFLGDVINSPWGGATGTDGAVVAFGVSAAVNGMIRGTTGADAAGDMATDGVQIQSFLNWKASATDLSFEARVKLSAITTIAIFVGFTDQIAALECPINGSGVGDAFTTTATDAVGFVFDTAMTNKKWWLMGVANDVDATGQNSAIAPVAATYNILRVDLTSAGVATFTIDGTVVGTAMTGAVTAATSLTPVIAAFSRTNAARNIDADYIRVQASRA